MHQEVYYENFTKDFQRMTLDSLRVSSAKNDTVEQLEQNDGAVVPGKLGITASGARRRAY